MTKRRFKLILVLCFTLAQMTCLKALCQTGQPMSDDNDHQKVAPILSVVRATGISVWIEYHGSCAADSSQGIPLQLRINSNEQESKTDALAGVRATLRENENLSISSATPGVINVSTMNAWSPILHARLNDLNLNSTELYNPNWAIAAAISASQASLQGLHAAPLIAFGSLLGEAPSKGRPHLKQSSKYTTLNDLLVDVSRTFGGVLVYKECSLADGTHLFDIFFYRQ